VGSRASRSTPRSASHHGSPWERTEHAPPSTRSRGRASISARDRQRLLGLLVRIHEPLTARLEVEAGLGTGLRWYELPASGEGVTREASGFDAARLWAALDFTVLGPARIGAFYSWSIGCFYSRKRLVDGQLGDQGGTCSDRPFTSNGVGLRISALL
jgi:hypothetical protein